MNSVLLSFVWLCVAHSFQTEPPQGAKRVFRSLTCGDEALTRRNVLARVASTPAFWSLAPFVAKAGDGATFSLPSCRKPSDGSSANCISTSSVKQLDLYTAPWVTETTVTEAQARLKGVVASFAGGEVVSSSSSSLVARIPRTAAVDEIDFKIRSEDSSLTLVTFTLTQVEGSPSLPGIQSQQRARLQEIIKRSGIFRIMGAEMSSADAGPREGPLGQLKAFYGLASGSGYEDILTGDD